MEPRRCLGCKAAIPEGIEGIPPRGPVMCAACVEREARGIAGNIYQAKRGLVEKPYRGE
jgi:hypothetical protein